MSAAALLCKKWWRIHCQHLCRVTYGYALVSLKIYPTHCKNYNILNNTQNRISDILHRPNFCNTFVVYIFMTLYCYRRIISTGTHICCVSQTAAGLSPMIINVYACKHRWEIRYRCKFVQMLLHTFITDIDCIITVYFRQTLKRPQLLNWDDGLSVSLKIRLWTLLFISRPVQHNLFFLL